jgi:hypothetical protein
VKNRLFTLAGHLAGRGAGPGRRAIES